VADREPMGTDGRLDDVHPGSATSDDHARHDRWLVVRAASDPTDLTAGETTAARALLADCHDCAALAADIATITHETVVSVAPVRRRDFRLTPTQAAAARGGFLDRLGRWLASPRASVLRPLAGASLAIGIVLVVVGPSIQGPVQAPAPVPNAAGAAPAQRANAGDAATTAEAASTPQGAATGAPDGAHLMDTQLAAPSGGPVNPGFQSRLGPDASAATATNFAKRSPDPEVAGIQAVVSASPTPDTSGQDAVEASTVTSHDDTATALVLLGIVLAGTGLLVLSLTWWLRRSSGDPLLR